MSRSYPNASSSEGSRANTCVFYGLMKVYSMELNKQDLISGGYSSTTPRTLMTLNLMSSVKHYDDVFITVYLHQLLIVRLSYTDVFDRGSRTYFCYPTTVGGGACSIVVCVLRQ